MIYRTAEETRSAGMTYHMTPVDVWERQQDQPSYLPEAYEVDGFIHCTDGLDQLVKVANMFYTGDARPYMVLVLDRSLLTAPVKYEDPDELFPHIYGPIETHAVVGTLAAKREADGTFVDFVPA